LRSPSSDAFEVRIRSARCFGVYASGEANRSARAAAGLPHAGQNFALAESSAPLAG
jgi:hypothetical protein